MTVTCTHEQLSDGVAAVIKMDGPCLSMVPHVNQKALEFLASVGLFLQELHSGVAGEFVANEDDVATATE